MKQFISIFLILIVLLLIPLSAGCNRAYNPANDGSGDKISVVATIFAPYDFTREITGDLASVSMLLPPASESHSYEPTPKDIIEIQNCDLFIYIGGESDMWVDSVLASMDTSNMKIITLMDCVEAVEEEIVEGMEDDGEDEELAYDEHVWTSPRNAKLIVSRISDALCEIDEANASTYKQNTGAYIEKLDDLDMAFMEVLNNAVRKTIVFGDRFPFRYFADAYGLDYFAAFPGCSAETEPSARTMAFLIDKVRDENIPVIFHAELSNEKTADAISESTGAKALLLHACHNISKTDFENGLSYMELMSRNVDALKEALR